MTTSDVYERCRYLLFTSWLQTANCHISETGITESNQRSLTESGGYFLPDLTFMDMMLAP